MSNVELVNEVFIDPIKSVLFIDDSFPTYKELAGDCIHDAEDIQEPFDDIADDEDFDADPVMKDLVERSAARKKGHVASESRRAYELTSSCRSKGFIFDVENNPAKVLNQTPEFLNKPDLIVLDYILEPNLNSSRKAIAILKRLSRSDRFNLVVLYTTKEPTQVLPEVAYALRGKAKYESTRGLQTEAGKIDAQDVQDNILPYLNSSGRNADTWRSRLGINHPNDDFVVNLIPHVLERHLENTYPEIGELNTDSSSFECSTDSSASYWVKGKNVFVAIVKKEEANDDDTIAALIHHLEAALAEYAPTPISMLLRKGINSFRNANIESLGQVMSDSQIRAAILYHAIESDQAIPNDELELKFRVTELSRRSFTAFSDSVHTSVGDFGKKLYQYVFPPKGEPYSPDKKIEIAIAKEKVGNSTPHREIALTLNAFLCSEKFNGSHLTNGVVFRDLSDKKRFFICATPSCDMVPRCSTKSGCYRKSLHPASCFEALRIEKVKSNGNIKKALVNAAHCKHVFLKTAEGTFPFEVIRGGGTGEPRPYIFYAQEGNIVAEGKLKLSEVKLGEDGNLQLSNLDVEIIGKLRNEYADRFLHQKGSHNSRIGVDFINYCERE